MLILIAEEREDKFTWCVRFSDRKRESKSIKKKVHDCRKHNMELLFKRTTVSGLSMRTVYINIDTLELNISD